MYCISSPIKRPQLSAETPSNRLMLPKKGKTIGYKPRPKFLIVAGHLSERTSQETSENGSLNTKPNELKKKKKTRKEKKQTHEEMWISIDPMKCINTTMQPATVFILCQKPKNRLAYRWRNMVILKINDKSHIE